MFGPSGVSIGHMRAVVGVVHVANLEAGAVTGQTAGAQGRQTALMGQFRQRVGLIHKLRQRRGAEELLDSRQQPDGC